MRYALVIFDFDGTLADSFPFFVEACDELAERHGFRKVSPEEIPLLRRLGAKGAMRHVGMPVRKLPAVAKDFMAMMRAKRDAVRPFKGVAEMIAALAAKGTAIAVVSSNAADNVAAVLGPATMRSIRYGAYGMSIFGKRAHLRRVLNASGTAAPDAIYIGDQTADMEAALAEGITPAAVAWGYGDVERLSAAGATHVFHAVEEIAARCADDAEAAIKP